MERVELPALTKAQVAMINGVMAAVVALILNPAIPEPDSDWDGTGPDGA